MGTLIFLARAGAIGAAKFASSPSGIKAGSVALKVAIGSGKVLLGVAKGVAILAPAVALACMHDDTSIDVAQQAFDQVLKAVNDAKSIDWS